MGLFRKGKTRNIAKFHRTDLVTFSHSREGKTQAYNQVNTVYLAHLVEGTGKSYSSLDNDIESAFASALKTPFYVKNVVKISVIGQVLSYELAYMWTGLVLFIPHI